MLFYPTLPVKHYFLQIPVETHQQSFRRDADPHGSDIFQCDLEAPGEDMDLLGNHYTKNFIPDYTACYNIEVVNTIKYFI